VRRVARWRRRRSCIIIVIVVVVVHVVVHVVLWDARAWVCRRRRL
jgi:hypothetical protein